MSENEGRDLSLAVTIALTAMGVMAGRAILGAIFNESRQHLI